MIAHIAKRFGLIVTGYVVAVSASAILVWELSRYFPGPTSFYVWRGPNLAPPELMGFLVALLFLALHSILPAVILILGAELFFWRRLWIYLSGALLVAVAAFPIYIPNSTVGLAGFDWSRNLAMTISALLGGLVYWTIAGRHAGLSIKVVTP